MIRQKMKWNAILILIKYAKICQQAGALVWVFDNAIQHLKERAVKQQELQDVYAPTTRPMQDVWDKTRNQWKKRRFPSSTESELLNWRTATPLHDLRKCMQLLSLLRDKWHIVKALLQCLGYNKYWLIIIISIMLYLWGNFIAYTVMDSWKLNFVMPTLLEISFQHTNLTYQECEQKIDHENW